MISVDVLADRNIDDDASHIFRGVHKMHDTNAVAISQPDMLGETLRPAASDANHITASNS